MGETINLVNNFKVEKVIFNCGEFNELEQELIKVLEKKKIQYYRCIKELNIDNNKLYFLNNKLLYYKKINDIIIGDVITMKISGLNKEYLQDLSTFLKYADTQRGIENDEEYPKESFHLDFFSNHSKEELYNYINQFLAHNKVNDDYDFYYFLKCVIKYMSMFSDSHTRVYKKDNIWFPIRFKTINNKVFIDQCFDKKMLRKRIKSVNGIKIGKVVTEIENCTSYGTKEWLFSNIEKMLSNRNDLLSLPCIHNKSDKIIFETYSNETMSFEVNKSYNEYSIYPKNNLEQYKMVDNTLMFKYPLCKEQFEPDINKIKQIIANNDIRKFVLDLRGNSGGNSNIIKPLIKYLSEKDLELFTIVDRNVFSSGRFAAIDMKRIGSKIVGEKIGTPINCFGYISGNGITPNSKINFHFARVYWYEEEGFMKGIFTKEDLKKQSDEFFKPKYLQIDIPIEVNEEDYTSSLDDIHLIKCMKLINKISNKKTK